MTDTNDTGAVAPAPQPAPTAEAPTSAANPKPPAKARAAKPKAVAPVHLVAVKDSRKFDLTHGEVVSAPARTAQSMIKAGVAREATPSEVDLAQPRIRVLG